MKKDKLLLILTLGLLAGIALVACGTQTSAAPEDAPQSSAPEPAPAKEEVTSTQEPAATEAPAEASAPSEVSFSKDVFPILDSRCIKCHGGEREEEGLILLTYEDVMAGSDNGLVVVSGDIEGSLLVELVVSKEMPKRGPKLTPVQIQVITDWVAAGAQNN